MPPIVKVFFATAILAAVLFGVVRVYLGGTESMIQSMDLKSLAYLREDEIADELKEKAEEALVFDEVPSAVEVLPDRAESTSVKLTSTDRDGEVSVDDNGCIITDSGNVADENDANTAQEESAEAIGEIRESGQRGSGGEAQDGADGSESGPIDCVRVQAAETEELEEPQETDAEAAARKMREKLGIKEPKPPTRAVDVKLALSEECEVTAVVDAPVSVQFRAESPIVRGASLLQLELLIAEFEACPDSEFQFSENVLGKVDASPSLTRMRFDELKYFFIQRSVPQTALRFPESP